MTDATMGPACLPSIDCATARPAPAIYEDTRVSCRPPPLPSPSLPCLHSGKTAPIPRATNQGVRGGAVTPPSRNDYFTQITN